MLTYSYILVLSFWNVPIVVVGQFNEDPAADMPKDNDYGGNPIVGDHVGSIDAPDPFGVNDLPPEHKMLENAGAEAYDPLRGPGGGLPPSSNQDSPLIRPGMESRMRVGDVPGPDMDGSGGRSMPGRGEAPYMGGMGLGDGAGMGGGSGPGMGGGFGSNTGGMPETGMEGMGGMPSMGDMAGMEGMGGMPGMGRGSGMPGMGGRAGMPDMGGMGGMPGMGGGAGMPDIGGMGGMPGMGGGAGMPNMGGMGGMPDIGGGAGMPNMGGMGGIPGMGRGVGMPDMEGMGIMPGIGGGAGMPDMGGMGGMPGMGGGAGMADMGGMGGMSGMGGGAGMPGTGGIGGMPGMEGMGTGDMPGMGGAGDLPGMSGIGDMPGLMGQSFQSKDQFGIDPSQIGMNPDQIGMSPDQIGFARRAGSGGFGRRGPEMVAPETKRIPEKCQPTTPELLYRHCCVLAPFFKREIARACGSSFTVNFIDKNLNITGFRRNTLPGCKHWRCVLKKYKLWNDDDTLNEDKYYTHLERWLETNPEFANQILQAKVACKQVYRYKMPLNVCKFFDFNVCIRNYITVNCPNILRTKECLEQKQFYTECREFYQV